MENEILLMTVLSSIFRVFHRQKQQSVILLAPTLCIAQIKIICKQERNEQLSSFKLNVAAYSEFSLKCFIFFSRSPLWKATANFRQRCAIKFYDVITGKQFEYSQESQVCAFDVSLALHFHGVGLK